MQNGKLSNVAAGDRPISMKSLLDAAKVFLIESLRDFAAGRLQFSILHAVAATELLLKERLSRVHPNLIYAKIDSRQVVQENTVGLRDLPQRLINLGIRLSEEETNVIAKVAKWRHEIVHHMPTYTENHAIMNLGLLYDFLSQFLEREMRLSFSDIIPKSSYKTASRLLKEWGRVAEKAREKAAAEGHEVDSLMECPECGSVGVVTIRGDKAFCHLCGSYLFFGDCPLCHSPALHSSLYLDDRVYHPKCFDRMIEDHLEPYRSYDNEWRQDEWSSVLTPDAKR